MALQTAPQTTPQIAKELTIGQLAQRSGVATSALRFYEDQGLITSRRTTGNQRRYRRDMLRRVAFIRVSQNVGMPLNAIREALARLPEGRTPTREDWAVVSGHWRRDLDSRIRQLQRLRDNLTDCIGCGCLSLESCMLANPYDICGETGCGPRRLLDDTDTDACGGPDTEAACAPTGAADRRAGTPAGAGAAPC
ncbi:redox-sensitive transcriptional activator SoxR [Streptomyces sp. DSM 44917]|uniref:Redox-sensitive transcriptional activator SoxR n=1 Tax=Streptomyces boetiae TaxID=3075541 RepID=A0ABU2L286_9ACTN|nr:redox-sensitive transcriptional activator SoxR [Streptomyces sp. DSM 44917]MDT0305531.1 redox-sensitive transcriptional activator SoxR [Streptomyces sp. DSM 44917]